MRCVLVLSLLVACGGSKAAKPDATRIDAAIDSPVGGGVCPCSIPPAGVEPCGTTCGNGAIDTCYTTSPLGCHCVTEAPEPCDGSATPSCADSGFYGGTMACTSFCTLDTTACDVCAPVDLGCIALSDARSFPAVMFAVSGTTVGVQTTAGVTLLDGLTKTGEVALANVGGLVAVPGGWLVATADPALVPLSTTGTLGAAVPLPAGALAPQMVYGAGGRVLVAWHASINMQSHVLAAIADTSGTIVVAAQDLFVDGGEPFGVTTDGTNFFVGTWGMLARITPTGTVTMTTGFPVPQTGEGPFFATWSGTTGWYVSYDGGGGTYYSFHAQRFDASGAKVGSAFKIDLGGTTTDFLADGTDLLAARFNGQHVGIVRIGPTGTVGATVDVGVGEPTGFRMTRAARLGSNLLVGWLRGTIVELAEAPLP